MYTADAGKCGLGLAEGRMMMPRGKMLGGSSGINYMAYVRGHPADFDAWAEGGATGRGYRDVLPYFKKSESNSRGASEFHGSDGPLRVSDHPAPAKFCTAVSEATAARQVVIWLGVRQRQQAHYAQGKK